MGKSTLNIVHLKGFVKKDPQVRYFSDTNIKAYFPLITYDIYKNDHSEKRISEFHNIVAWKEIALAVEKSIKEGQFVELKGRLKTNTYEKDGEQKLSVQIVLSEFDILEEQKTKSIKSYPPSNEKTEFTPMDNDFFDPSDEDNVPF